MLLCLRILSKMNQPISLIFNLRIFSCSFLNILWSKLGSYKTKQTKLFSLSFIFFLSKHWYINSEKKLSEKNRAKKNRPDLPTLFQI